MTSCQKRIPGNLFLNRVYIGKWRYGYGSMKQFSVIDFITKAKSMALFEDIKKAI